MGITDWISNRLNMNSNLEYSDYSLMSPKRVYQLLDEHYRDTVDYSVYAIDYYRNLRDPVNRSVEFYASKIMPSYNIISENQLVVDSINQIHKWSNFDSTMQVFKRCLALYGDLFVRVSTDVDKVYFEYIKPEYVTDFVEDSRGFLQEIRIDIPTKDEYGKTLNHTEYWDKETYAIWESFHSAEESLSSFGDPVDYGFLAEFGIDFIPIIHMKFKDVGEPRGKSCVIHALRKIDAANKNATRLDSTAFKTTTWMVTQEENKTATTLPVDPITILRKYFRDNTDMVRQMARDGMMTVPYGMNVSPAVPGIDYKGILDILNALMQEIEQDLPELRYYSIEDSNLSGKAIRLLLGAAIDRAKEAENNFVQGMERADEIALTMGKNLGLFPSRIGNFEDGSFDHEYKIPEMFEQTDDEKALTLKGYVDAGFSTRQAMQLAGYSEEEIITILGVEVTQPTPQQLTPQEMMSQSSIQPVMNITAGA